MYLATEHCYQKEGYLVIDEWILPTVEWMNKNGYITLHSCSGHEDGDGFRRNHWYMFFVATVSIRPLRQKTSKLSMNIERVRHNFLTRAWTLSMFIEPRTSEEIKKRNEEVCECLRK